MREIMRKSEESQERKIDSGMGVKRQNWEWESYSARKVDKENNTTENERKKNCNESRKKIMRKKKNRRK